MIANYTTTRDRAMLAAAEAEWVDTYGTTMPALRRNLGRIVSVALVLVAGLALLVGLVFAGSHALHVSDCQHMVATAGATDAPAVVACQDFLSN